MEARFDTATMFALSIILLVFSAVDINADIPDGVVYTDVHKTVIEGDDAVLKCHFRGTPFAVYWKKGSDPESAPNLITWVEDLPQAGSCIEDGACEITDDFSLILKEVGMEDQGRYICRVSNYKGILIHNFTNVKVIDPDELSIHTEPFVMGWAGSAVNLPCNFKIEPQKVLWKRIYGDGGNKVKTLLNYKSDGHGAPGIGRYSWSKNFGLVIRDLHVSDEGNFTCLVSTIDGIEIKNSTVLVVNATKIFFIMAYIQFLFGVVFASFLIMMCRRRSIAADQISFWKIMIEFLLGVVFVSSFIWMCIRISRETAPIPIWMIVAEFLLGVVFVSSLILACKLKPRDCFHRPNADIELEADIERKRLMEQERKLDDLRKQLKKYSPGEATDIQNTKRFPLSINLGVFGVMGVGKSSLINSLSFALKSTFENVVSRVSDGGEVEFGDRIRLTEHITILDNRGMRDLSEKQIKDSLIPQIRGERGVDCDNGVVTHCPIFVHDIRKPFDPMCIFLKQFTSAVHEHYGRHVMVVFTHKNTVENPDFNISCTRDESGIPEEHIWLFENYTENTNNEDVEKSIKYLEFLQKCLEIGEKNIYT